MDEKPENERNYTTISLKKETKSDLDSMKIIPDESHDSVVKRLIEGARKKMEVTR